MRDTASYDQFGDYWFFVDDPTCPDAILQQVLDHFETLSTAEAHQG